ncbi:hypothetical protein Tco_1003327, partial [Tanacetum coccineum]
MSDITLSRNRLKEVLLNYSLSELNALELRPLIREFFKYKIGNGNNVSLWYDHYCSISPLASIVATRYMNRDGLNTSSKVSDVFKNGNVVWPQDLVARYPLLGSVVGPNSVGSIDTLEWRDNVGVVKPFLVNAVWQALRPKEDKITWVDVDWAGLSKVAPSIDLIIDVIIPTAKRRTLKYVIDKLVVAEAAYFIWHERNCRLFKKGKRSEDQVVDCILSSARLKLFSCRFNQSREGLDLMRRWKILESIFLYDDVYFVFALVEVSSVSALVDSLVVDIPFDDGSGHSLETLDIEYEWKSPR